MYEDKDVLLGEFRYFASRKLSVISQCIKEHKKRASIINTEIKKYKDHVISGMYGLAHRECWGNERILNAILMINYVADIVMLESRNKVWPYEYMAFSRRIGELWEPFCKETFFHPVRELAIVEPPDFNDVQNDIESKVSELINDLNVNDETKRELLYYYNMPWLMVHSGGIKLDLDLHFRQNGTNYNCDFKSGFGSNEKGNTNRLLLVASIYRLINENDHMILFVRQPEQQNNHYLQALKKSGYWDVYCADDAYEAMFQFTGFNLRAWLDNNATWVDDIEDQLRERLIKRDLIHYLTW